ncbi:MAG: hypothetical protein AAF242_15250 [Bacteroidota bacterium]
MMVRQTLLFLALAFILASCGGLDTAAIQSLSDKDQKFLRSQNYLSTQHGQFYVHYPKGSYADRQAETYPKELDEALQRSLITLGVSSYTEPVHFIVFESREDIEAHLGRNRRYLINTKHNVGYLVHNKTYQRPYFTHPLFLLAANKNWGPPKDLILSVGGAFFADGRCGEYTFPFEDIGTYLLQSQKYIPLRTLMDNYLPWLQAKEPIAEVEAALLFQFVHDNFNKNRIKQLWRNGIRDIEGIIGLQELEIAREIEARLRLNTTAQNIDWATVEGGGC